MTHQYIQHGARTLVQNMGGRILDLPGYTLDALAGQLAAYRAVRRRYDRSRWPRRTRGQT